MVEIVYEHLEPWPENGPGLVNIPSIHIEVSISPDVARRRANGYLLTYVSMTLHAIEPKLVIAAPDVDRGPGAKPCWRFSLEMRLRGVGPVATLGTIEIDAQNGEVIPLSPEQIRSIQERADAYITLCRFSSQR